MSTTSTLPSIGQAPPNLVRKSVPEALQPRIVREANKAGEPHKLSPPPKPPIKQAPPPEIKADNDKRSSANLGGASAVAVQVENARASVAPPPPIEQTIEQPVAEPRPAPHYGAKLSSELNEDEKISVAKLEGRDLEVRTHEAAHASVGGGIAGSPQYQYARGPDGKQYAVGGTVDIDVSTVPGDPKATIEKMVVVQQAALAPARPSGQDRAVAGNAMRQAQAELNAMKVDEREAAEIESAEKRAEKKAEETPAAEPQSPSPFNSSSIVTPIVTPIVTTDVDELAFGIQPESIDLIA